MIVKVGNTRIDARNILAVQIITANLLELLVMVGGAAALFLGIYVGLLSSRMPGWSKQIGMAMGLDAGLAKVLLLACIFGIGGLVCLIIWSRIERAYVVRLTLKGAPQVDLEVLSLRDARDLEKRLSDLQRQYSS